MDIAQKLTEFFHLPIAVTQNVIALLDEGNTIPFIARYRKELTNAMEDSLLRDFSEKLSQLRNLNERREAIKRLIAEQEKLTAELELQLDQTESITVLEDLYRPFKPKRKTRAATAIARGFEPLADALVNKENKKEEIGFVLQSVKQEAEKREEKVLSKEEVLQGAGDILAERLSDDPSVRKALRGFLSKYGKLHAEVGKNENPLYEQYVDYEEAIKEMPAHRLLALNRAEREEAIKVNFLIDETRIFEALFRELSYVGAPYETFLREVAKDSWKRLLKPSLTKEVRKERTQEAEEVSIDLFKKNLRELLLEAPIKNKTVLGFDPGYRNGCKIAVVDPQGEVLSTLVIYPHSGDKAYEAAKIKFLSLLKEYSVELIVIGNGTASRESERFVCEIVESNALSIPWLIVSEAGASVYSASVVAGKELGHLDINLRSAVSIARRVQDPLAELVKIDPKSIGVGQYQHDLNQKNLALGLDSVIEDCVNHVGVNLNTASHFLLVHIAGISAGLADNILAYRSENGAFSSRKMLLKVPKLGQKSFEQCAGFLRVEGNEPLDNTSVHPESYAVVKAMQKAYAVKDFSSLVALLEKENLAELARQFAVGKETLKDIIEALKKPGRDPREDFTPPVLRHDLLEIEDLEIGMELSGVVRNIAAFGAFVDIGLHENGLIHISELSDKFIKDPFEVLKIGQEIKVKIISLDLKKKRIGLSRKGL